jgi:glucose-6-phosphate isomerase
MAVQFNSTGADRYIEADELAAMLERAGEAKKLLDDGDGPGAEYLGWVSLPENYDGEELIKVHEAATAIRAQSDILVVIGIGGSYLGARAVAELLQVDHSLELIFAGKSLSPREMTEILKRLEGKNWSINVISKSGTTTEPAIALRILRQKLVEQYGAEEANKRIYATTDREKGTLHDLAVTEGWSRFVVPDNIGGRYSVLTAVGLLPIAAAGVDIEAMLEGALAAKDDQAELRDDALRYAALRNVLYEKGYNVEVLSTFEPAFESMQNWWKQLFGESEGKNQKGILPDSMVFTTDLHSLGQFMQDGTRRLIETFVEIEKSQIDLNIPDDTVEDGVGYLAGRTLSEVNQKALEATVKAHIDGGVPVFKLVMPEINAFEIGYFIYFAELACGISAYTLGVNPFNQPGVEEYKRNMFALLGKV